MRGSATIPRVTFFQRRPRKGFNFSLEYIFDDVKGRLREKIEQQTYFSTFYNNGYFSKFINILEATYRQGSHINHITGEVHFLNVLMVKKRVILTILDCGMVHRKKGIEKSLINWLYLTLPVKRAEIITTISEETKREVIKYTNCNSDKIKVIPVAINALYKPSPKKFNSQKPVILQIGTGYNKNITRLLEALNGINCHLVLVGSLSTEQKTLLREFAIDFTNEHNLSNEQLYQKYLECDIVSFVSTFEGFGMPIIEGNAVERVVITSNVSSMVEVAGDAACLVDPFDVDSIRHGFTKIITSELYRTTLIANGRKNKEKYDPDTIAEMYYKLYEELHAA